MANIKSAMKRIRTNEQNRLRNKSVKSEVKTAIRKFREAAAAGEKDKAVELQRAAARTLAWTVTLPREMPAKPAAHVVKVD